MEKRPKNCIRGKIPKVDAVRDLLSRIDPKEIEEIHAQTILNNGMGFLFLSSDKPLIFCGILYTLFI